MLRAGVAVGVAYGIWGATGTALTAVLGAAIFRDPLTWAIAAGIALIIAGVLLVELGSHPEADGPDALTMWLTLLSAIAVEVFATLALRASDGLPQEGVDRSHRDRLPGVVLSAVADAGARDAGGHRLRRLDGVRRRAALP